MGTLWSRTSNRTMHNSLTTGSLGRACSPVAWLSQLYRLSGEAILCPTQSTSGERNKLGALSTEWKELEREDHLTDVTKVKE